MAVCWCNDPNCEQIFSTRELKDIDLFAKNALLPCGHKPGKIIFGTSAIRAAENAERELERIRPRLKRICEVFCDNCCYADKFCGRDPLGERCHEFED